MVKRTEFHEYRENSYWLILGGYEVSWLAGYVVIFALGAIGFLIQKFLPVEIKIEKG